MESVLNLTLKVKPLKLSNYDLLITKLNKLKGALIEIKPEAEIAALKTIEANMKQRVFDNSTGTSGEVFGSYRSEAYKKRRKDLYGHTNVVKNLQFSGAFIKDLQVGTSGGKNVFGFKSDISVDIVKGQENGSKTRYGTFVPQIGFPIFKIQGEEADLAYEEYSKVINDKIIEVFNV